ncbi:hypothetical protein P43SY_005666 [Pythium insidiosum]|uniref:Uncharacterized protein n=1 Tax=Pythium insidiosum TaxID=114742 RepID=A0AAD5M5C4_PYTIN|nr:hypothetical protein P43SY_005666 [Pythium insidiosum]
MAFTSAPSPRSRPFGSTVGGSWEAMRHDPSGPFDRRPTRGWFPTTSSETPRFSIWPPPPAALKPSMTMTAAAPSEGWGWRPPAQSTASSSIAGFGATPPVSAPTPAPPAPSVGFDFSSLRANSTASMHVSPAPPALSDSVAHGDGVRFGFAGVDSEPDATNEAARVAAVDDQPFGSGNTGDGLLERTVQEALVGGSLQAATAHGDEEIPAALSPPRASAGGSRSAAFVRRTPAPRLGRHRGPIVVETAVETAVAGTQDAPEDAQDSLRDYDL